MAVDEDEFLSQVDRILHSEELRSSETQRRLFKFLADKSILGEADGLNEYAVATDGLGKPPSYDPRHNSAVRIQVGRLRQSIAEYYRSEGKKMISLLTCRRADLSFPAFRGLCRLNRQQHPQLIHGIRMASSGPCDQFLDSNSPDFGGFSLFLFGLYFLRMQKRMHTADASTFPGWSSDLTGALGALCRLKVPLILTIEDPLFRGIAIATWCLLP